MAVMRLAPVNVGTSVLAAHPIYYVCDTTAEVTALNSGLKLGDTALAKDTNVLYKAASTSTWTPVDAGAVSSTLPPDVVVASNDMPTAVKNGADFICDGTADQTEINLAIDMAAAIAGRTSPGSAAPTVTNAVQRGKVKLSGGRFVVNSPILMRSGVHLQGTGRLTQIRSATSAFTDAGAGAGGALIKKSDASQHLTTVSDLLLDGASSSGTAKYGIHYDGTGGDYSAYPSTGSGDSVDTVRDVWIEQFTGSARGGIYFASTGGLQKAWLIANCHIHTITGSGLEVSSAADGEIIGVDIGGCTVDGFKIAAPNIRMSACKAWYCDAYGFEFASGRQTGSALEAQDCATGFFFNNTPGSFSALLAETSLNDGVVVGNNDVQIMGLKIQSRGSSGRYATQTNGLRFSAAVSDCMLLGSVDSVNITNKIAGTTPTIANRNFMRVGVDAGTGTGTGGSGLGTGSLTLG